jgi:putative tryptophan/tyrosine transport system substrate-binding protein
MRRIIETALSVLLFVGTCAPLAAQAPERVYRIAYLTGGVPAARENLLNGFRAGMAEFGYQEGRNYTLEIHGANNQFERLPALAAEVLARHPDLLVASTSPGAQAAKAATSKVPIVMVGQGDPVGLGIIDNLARPGGNITGITNSSVALAGKRLELLKELIPSITRVAIFVNPNDPNAELQIDGARQAAPLLGLTLEPMVLLRNERELESAFPAAIAAGAQAVLRLVDPTTSPLRQRTVALAEAHRLPVIFAFREDAEAGGLISYGTDLASQYRRAASFVHRILQGAAPGDLPVEQPTTFELVVNLKTAAALGIAVSPALIARADQLLE